jgi:hypothetical protein
MTKLRNGAPALKGWNTRRRNVASRARAVYAALTTARRVLADERREQFSCFVIPGTKDSPEAYKHMNPGERAAIRRFDRAIAKIDEVLK